MIKFSKFVLDHFPDKDFPQNLSCFHLQRQAQVDPRKLKPGQVLLQVHYLSLDPVLRTWISGAKSYFDPVGPGSSIPGFGLGKVVKVVPQPNKKGRFQEGDWVIGSLQWSQYVVIDIRKVQKLPVDMQEENYKYLSTYGSTGLTSYISIKEEIQPFKIFSKKLNRYKNKQELNIVISSVAGGVGLTLTEYLRLLGFKNVYGIAGSDQKCQVAKEVGCKDAINYKKYYTNGVIRDKQFGADIKKMMGGEQCDLYYENVGEDMLTSMLNIMATNSKIVMCGALATYNNWNEKSGVANLEKMIFKRVEMKGILYFYRMTSPSVVKSFMEMMALNPKGASVLIKGIEKLPTSYRDMIAGRFIGKPVIQIQHAQ